MSAQQPTYEETVAKQAALEKEIIGLKTLLASKKGSEDEDDEKLEASFKKAQSEMDKEKKDHEATMDEHEKVKDAFKKAEEETDKDKKHEAMKKALEMEEDYQKSKKGKTAEEKPTENVDKDKDAKIASIVMKKIPIMQKILEATKQIDPTNYEKVEKELTAATLEECEAKLASIEPYMAAIGLGTITPQPGMTTMVPFQASAAVQSSDNVFEGGIDEIDFSKVSTKTIMEMN